jgi:hypothetical protein
MRVAGSIILLCALLPLHVAGLRGAAEEWKTLPRGDEATYAIPSAVLKLTSLEFDGVVSDFLFLKAMVFLGGTNERSERPRVKEWEWRLLYSDLVAITDLDPYFFDPYYFAQGHLTWEGDMVRETNALLAKGSQHRSWDWLLPFYMGFNHFYFLQENDQASLHLMEAARRVGNNPTLTSLATRLALKDRRTENAIFFLQEMLKREEDETIRGSYLIRLEALQGIFALERGVLQYKESFGEFPSSLEMLVKNGLLQQVPADPYGGEFYIDADGMIKTTSELRARM